MINLNIIIVTFYIYLFFFFDLLFLTYSPLQNNANTVLWQVWIYNNLYNYALLMILLDLIIFLLLHLLIKWRITIYFYYIYLFSFWYLLSFMYLDIYLTYSPQETSYFWTLAFVSPPVLFFI